MKTKEYSFNVDGIAYVIPVTYKRQRGLYLRATSKGGFKASAPILMSEHHVVKFISESLPTLIKRVNKRKINESPIGDNYTYLFGEKVERVFTKEELKKIALIKFANMTRQCEKEMGIRPYKVHIRDMTTRFGSNSIKTRGINYQLNLVHFSREIVRSVVVHELAHDKYRNHGDAFYKLVLTYCPNYWELKKKLRKGIYK